MFPTQTNIIREFPNLQNHTKNFHRGLRVQIKRNKRVNYTTDPGIEGNPPGKRKFFKTVCRFRSSILFLLFPSFWVVTDLKTNRQPAVNF